MASFVYYKFKAQKSESRIVFDGTGISVFDLKKEIILANKLGKASDFDLLLYDSANRELSSDSEMIPRSSSVIAKRMPPVKPGKGKAAMYIASALPPASSSLTSGAASSSRADAKGGPSFSTAPSWSRNAIGAMSKRFDGREDRIRSSGTPVTDAKATPEPQAPTNVADDEAERIKAMFQANEEHWEETQERMSHATRIDNPRGGGPRRSFQTHNFPKYESKPLPPGYICHRCNKRGHWISDCPTNDDRDFDNRPRVKRTTGIPRSFLKTVEGTVEAGTQGVMITPDGSFVVAQPDVASWEKQRARQVPLTESEIRERVPSDSTLACPICTKLLRDAVKTPCCGTSFDEECIQTHLLERDFDCFSCHKKVASLDKLMSDASARQRVRQYIADEISKSATVPADETDTTGSARGTPPTDSNTTAPPGNLADANDDPDAVYESQPGTEPTQAQQPSLTDADPEEISRLNAQLNQIMIAMQNPNLPQENLVGLQSTFQKLMARLNELQPQNPLATNAMFGGAGAFNPSAAAMMMGGGMPDVSMLMGMMSPGMMNGLGYGGHIGGDMGNTSVSHNPYKNLNDSASNDADSPYQRVAVNNRGRNQKRERPQDFIDLNSNQQKQQRMG